MDLTNFNANSAGNPNNNIFGLPSSEADSRLILLPVPWEVTVSYGAGTARCPEHILSASLQIDLFDADMRDLWKNGFYMRPVDKKILLKSDYLRKEAELYIDYSAKGGLLENNKFMQKSLKEINEGSIYLNNWVYEETKALLAKEKLVGLIGGDHSTPIGFYKALEEKHGSFGILQIDAHADLRKDFEGFKYSHASIMYNSLQEIPGIEKLVQVGVRDYCEEEYEFILQNQNRVHTFFDQQLKERSFIGKNWDEEVKDIIACLPEKVCISFDIDGLDPKLCPHTGTPVPGGLQEQQALYLFKQLLQSGRKLIGFDLVEVVSTDDQWDTNVAAHLLWKLCNFLMKSNG
ncbi:MAG: agmatinase family protein [Bacteroidetes bacterium]|nr:agmatinase family protein [Bacteroidota bacterium]